MTYLEMKDAVINALANMDYERLNHLKQMDGRWFEDIIEEIESEMEITIKRTWEA